jgi:type IV pilus assembly protein PilA
LRVVSFSGTVAPALAHGPRPTEEESMSSMTTASPGTQPTGSDPALPVGRGRDRVVRLNGAPSPAPSGLAGPRPRPAHRGRTGPRGTESGFTLVELLVVVLVIGTLVAVAVPTFVGQRERAWDAAVTSELRGASIALESYRAQNGEYSLLALQPGSGWGYEASGNLDLRPPVISTTEYCLIAQYVSGESPNTNRTWRVRQDTSVRRIDTATGTCQSPALAD